jgi:gluconokinase
MVYVVLDMGSSSVRALLFDAHGQRIEGAGAAQPHQFSFDASGTSTASAAELCSKIEACIDALLAHPQAHGIHAVGMATFVGNLLGVDANGQLLTPIYTYSDSRSAGDAALLATRVDGEAVHQRTGCRIHSAYHPAKLAWLRRTQPDLVAQVAQWTDIGTYLYRRWFGRAAACSHSVASWSGLLDRARATWDDQWLTLLGLDETQLPRTADAHIPMNGLAAAYARRWPALADVPWFLPVGDGAAANVGSGAGARGPLALTLGTTAALRTVTDDLPDVPAGLWGYRIDRTRHLVGGATSEGGNVFAWARQTLHLPDPEATERALMSAAPDQHGITALPLFAGERSPGWQANATAALHGMRLSSSALDVLQALLEGVAHRLALIAEQLNTDGVVYAGGKALHQSRAWAHMICNAFNRPLALLDEPEVTARGVALLLMQWLDGANLALYPPRVHTILSPVPAAAARMAEARARQTRLYGLMYGENGA